MPQRLGGRPRRVLRFGLPTLIVGALALVALWRIPAHPPAPADTVGTAGRSARLENVEIQSVASPRTFWIAGGAGPSTFAVLDADAKRVGEVRLAAGAHVDLVGLVLPAPAAADAIRQWGVNEGTAAALEKSGTYLHVVEIVAR